MLNTEPIPFGDFTPDQASIKPGASQLIKNVQPHADGYGPSNSLDLIATGIANEPLGALQYYVGGNSFLLIGDAANLYWITASGATSGGTGYTANDVDGWAFDVFGDFAYAINETDGLLSADSSAQGAFSAVAGSPNAKYLQDFKEFLFAGQVTGEPARIQWSAFNDPTDWVVNPGVTQADFNDMPAELGAVQGLTGGQYIKVYQRRGISRGTFVGGSTIFRFDTMDRSKGLLAPKSLVSTGVLDFFLSDDGFNVFDTQRVFNIGDDRVNEFFYDRCPSADRPRVRGSIDYRRRMVTWTWPGSRDYLRYSYKYDKWVLFCFDASLSPVNVYPIEVAKPGYTLDETAPGETTDLDGSDSLPASFDDPFWISENAEPGFLLDGNVYQATGGSLVAVLETSDTQPAAARRSYVNELWPMVDADTVSGIVAAREQKVGGIVIDGASTAMNQAGFCPAHKSGRYFRARVEIAANQDWTRASGVQMAYKDAGKR